MEFMGLPEMPVKGINISHCRITADRGASLRFCEDITFTETHVIAKTGQTFTVSHSQRINGIQQENDTVTPQSNWTSLFNGLDLSGWHIECKPADRNKVFWTVVDGSIECNSMGRSDHHYVWLVSDKEYSNFTLRFKFKAWPESRGNSGINFRSSFDSTLAGGWLNGPQMDIHPVAPNTWRTGMIYDETYEVQHWWQPLTPRPSMPSEHKPSNHIFKYADEGWNEVELHCLSTHIRTIVNGIIVSDWDGAGLLDDFTHVRRNAGMSGHLALQLHRGDEIRIQYKDIEIQEIPSNVETQPLKDAYANAFLMGCAINRSMAYEEDTAAVALLTSQFNVISPESDLKPERLHPTPTSWTFEHADRYIRFAEEHHLAALGHTLIWHNQTPGWFWVRDNGTPKPRTWILDNMEEYVETVTAHFAGKVYAWDVINELLDEDGSYRTNKGWGMALGGDCDELVRRAFASAHRGAPDAELYYNDYNLWRPSKLAGVVRMVRMLQSEGIRIDGVGIQAHWGLNYPNTALIAQAIDTLYALGVKVMFSELDVDVLPVSKEGQMSPSVMSDPVFQREEFFNWLNPYPNGLPADVDCQLANRYGELFSVLYSHRNKIDRVTFWGLHDGVSWKNGYPVHNRTNYPLLFDRRLKPKAAYSTVIQIPQ